MGCGRTKLSTSPEIDLSLEPTYVARFDEVINTLQAPLDVLIAALKVTRNEQRAVVKAFGLWETVRDAEVRDVMLALALMAAGECRGDFTHIGFEMTSKSPYIRLEGAVSEDCGQRIGLLRGFIQHLEAIPGHMRRIQPELANALTRANGNAHSAISSAHKTELSNSNLGALEANRVREKIQANIIKIRAAGTLAVETTEAAAALLKQVREGASVLRTYSALWTQVSPGDIRSLVQTHWPQPARLLSSTG